MHGALHQTYQTALTMVVIDTGIAALIIANNSIRAVGVTESATASTLLINNRPQGSPGAGVHMQAGCLAMDRRS